MEHPAMTLALGGATLTVGPGIGLSGWPGLAGTAPLFQLLCDGDRIDGSSVRLAGVPGQQHHHDRHQVSVPLRHASGLAITVHLASYAGGALLESWLEVRNTGDAVRRISRIDSFVADLDRAAPLVSWFTGAWGLEFEPQQARLRSDEHWIAQSRSGRSSHGDQPWCAIDGGPGVLAVAVAWSGNWAIRLEPHATTHRLSAGIHDWEFFVDLAPGEQLGAPAVVIAGAPDLNAASQAFADAGRRHWYPHNPLADRLPVEWNHWWSYEDKTLDDAVFRENAVVAARLGIEVCTLDAGWFGPGGDATGWYARRGDWDLVDAGRFPAGIRAVSDAVHALGMAFGLWCEIEGLGTAARLAVAQPELVARRDAAPLGYVCLGSQAGRDWAFATLDRLITSYRCDWIKLDFNLDPGAGCNRTDHGHGAGDGLYRHYRGYYALLDAIRARHPHVVLENCSSGGLRIDLGIARHTHMAFQSDPDWPEHSLSLFWGGTTLLAPEALLHWGFCEWAHTQHRCQTFDPSDPALTPTRLDYYTRISMLRRFGFSQRLPNLPAWVAQRYAQHIAAYRQHVRRLMPYSTVRRLDPQPLREGRGCRWAGIQYSHATSGEHLLAVFRLPGGEPTRHYRLHGIVRDQTYRLTWLADDRDQLLPGAVLADGLQFTGIAEEGSALILIEPLAS
jgi:alpha-galactosidase